VPVPVGRRVGPFLSRARPFDSPPPPVAGRDQGLKSRWPLSPVTVYAASHMNRCRVNRKRVSPYPGPGCVEGLAEQNETVWNSLRASSEAQPDSACGSALRLYPLEGGWSSGSAQLAELGWVTALPRGVSRLLRSLV